MLTKSTAILLILLEGSHLTPYRDTKNILTVGVGHALFSDAPTPILTGVVGINRATNIRHLVLTQEEVEQLLMNDLQARCSAVIDNVQRQLKNHEFDSLMSFCFNVGVTAFKKSTLIKKINEGAQTKDILTQINRWTSNNCAGTIKRRLVESAVFANSWQAVDTKVLKHRPDLIREAQEIYEKYKSR
jgi:lysozyme